MASEDRVIATNRRARHEYEILETVEAGLVLRGTEVKSLRTGQVNFKDSYATVRNGEPWLLGCHISPYSHGTDANHDPERDRKLLLHAREIGRPGRQGRRARSDDRPAEVYTSRADVRSSSWGLRAAGSFTTSARPSGNARVRREMDKAAAAGRRGRW